MYEGEGDAYGPDLDLDRCAEIRAMLSAIYGARRLSLAFFVEKARFSLVLLIVFVASSGYSFIVVTEKHCDLRVHPHGLGKDIPWRRQQQI